jgi:hypothetical protein
MLALIAAMRFLTRNSGGVEKVSEDGSNNATKCGEPLPRMCQKT